MVAILRLIWGLFSRVGAWVLPVISSVGGLMVASAAARFVAVMAAVVALVLWMPLPSFVESVPSLAASIPPEVVYVMSYARVPQGVAIILGSLVTRFVARLVLKAMAG